MFDLTNQVKGYNPGTPLVGTVPKNEEEFIRQAMGGGESFNRKYFTPKVQEEIIGAQFGNVPKATPSTTPTPGVNDLSGVPPEELARLQRLDKLVSRPDVLKAIGDVIIGMPETPNPNGSVSPQVTSPPPGQQMTDNVPPAAPQTVTAPAVPGAPNAEDAEADAFLNKLWGDVNDVTPAPAPIANQTSENIIENVATTLPASPTPPAQPVATNAIDDVQREIIGEATKLGVDVKDFNNYMANEFKSADFVRLYMADRGLNINQSQPPAAPAPSQVAVADTPTPNLAETPGQTRVPVYAGVTGMRRDVDTIRI